MDTSFAVSGSPRVSVENESGAVRVVPGAADRVEVRVLRRIPASDSASAASFLESMRVDWDVRGDEVNIHANVKRSRRERMLFGGLSGLHEQERGRIDLELVLPARTDLDVITMSGDQVLEGIEGSLRLESTSGGMDLSSLSGQVRATSSSGDIDLDGSSARARLVSTSGDLDVRNLTGDITIRTTSGDIRLRHLHGDADIAATSGDVDIQNLEGAFVAHTTSGSIRSAGLTGSAGVSSGGQSAPGFEAKFSEFIFKLCKVTF